MSTPAHHASPEKTKARNHQYLFAAILAAALVTVLALLLYDKSDAHRYQKYRRQATESYQRGDYDSALSDLRRAAALDPNEECLMLMADCYEAQENWEKALEILRKMDRNDPTVVSRIAAVEQKRSQQLQEQLRMVAGVGYAADTAELSLDGRGLGDGVLREVQQLHALTSLSLAGNSLQDVSALESLGGLSTLDLSGNAVTDLSPLGKLTNLRSLNLAENPIEDLTPLYALTDLNELDLRGVALDAKELDALSQALPHCAILSNGTWEGEWTIRLSGVAFSSTVEELSLRGLGLRDIHCLSLCTKVRILDLRENEISDLSPLMNLQTLELLRVSDNQISDLRPLIGMGKLTKVEAARNAVTETTTIGSMSGLTLLDLSDNPLEDFTGLRKLRSLQSLSLENTGIGDEDLQNLYELSHLGKLALDRNEGLTDSAMSKLRAALPGCAVTHSKLVYPVELGGLSFRSDDKTLSIVGTELSDLSGLEKFDCLETVTLSQNRIESIRILQYCYSRECIKSLDLSFNQIRDLDAIPALRALETLDLSGNQISSVQPLMRMTWLKTLHLDGNPLTGEQIDALREALPDCEISF